MSVQSHRLAVARWKRRNPERHREHQRRKDARYRADPRNKLKINARAAVRKAVRDGRLLLWPCENDAAHPGPIEFHHHLGYEPEHWLDVRRLCVPCHRLADQEQRRST